jgi:hypothetical protein
MSRRSVRRPLAFLALVLAACSDSTAPDAADDLELSEDVALSAAAATTTGLLVLRGDMARSGLPGAFLPGTGSVGAVSESCVFEEATKSWFCEASAEIGLEVERRITIFADDVAGPLYNPTTTDSIRVQTSATGEIAGERGTISASHAHDVTVSGLEGAETQRTVNGNATRDEQVTFTGDRGTRTWDGTTEVAFQSIVFPVNGGHPLSGTLVHQVDATVTISGAREETRQISRRVEIAFNGTATVPLTVGTLECTLNLETGRVACSR